MFRSKNPYLQAAIDALIVLATTHLIILIGYAVAHGNYQLLNIFHIQDLDRVFPGIATGWTSFGFSITFGLAIYLLVFWINRRRS